VREGSLLKCSDSMKRSSRFQLMEAGATGGGGCWRVGGWAWTYVYMYCKVSLMFGVQMMLERIRQARGFGWGRWMQGPFIIVTINHQ
jgi:hypothetical protein